MKNEYSNSGRIKKVCAVILTALLLISAMPVIPGAGRVSAANPVFVRIYLNGAWKMDLTDSISTLNSYINKNKDKNIRLEMLTDWNAAAVGRQSDFDKSLVIPSGARVTLDMHGHVFNRDNAWKDHYTTDGDVIQVESNATLTINGSSTDEEKNTLHKDVPVYTSTHKGYTAVERKNFTGGLIMGGVNSAWGGGLTIKSGCTVTLNDVTIAGCCSRDTSYTDNGYGGAIRLRDDDCRLTLNNCLITGNMSDDQGGGICVCDDDKFIIELNNTIIEKNFASKKGGGIYLGG